MVLPVALVAGYFLREVCAMLSVFVPYVIFMILLLTFSGVKVSRLRPGKFDLWLALFQTVVSFAVYWSVYALTRNDILAQGAMICAICPVASSVTAVAAMLGANPVSTTTYTIAGNLLTAVVAPMLVTMINSADEVSVINSFLIIFCKTAPVIALPYFVALTIQKFMPKVNDAIARYKGQSFYLWAFALFVTIGQTADFVMMRWHHDGNNVIWLCVESLIMCILQFGTGRLIGKRYGDKIAGGQLLGQKNSAMGIWIVNTFLNPVASVAMAGYSIWQNIFNSWQIYRIKN